MQMMLSAPDVTLKGVGCLLGLKASATPVLYRRGLAAVEKTDAGLRAWIGQLGPDGIDADTSFDVDVVCVGYGFQPNNEILRNLGCSHHYDENRGQLVPERSAEFETSVSGVYAVGDCCGLGGAPAACAEGSIAGSAVVRSLGLTLTSRLIQLEADAIKDLRRHRAFQAALWNVFSAPRLQTELAKPDTLICRCEKIRLREFEDVLADGEPSIGAIKRRTRLGMGACQGRYCAPIAAAMLAKRDGRNVNEAHFFAPRSPLKPMRIADLLKTSPD
jgi:NAD(P)H-nitrite reductase large subunit